MIKQLVSKIFLFLFCLSPCFVFGMVGSSSFKKSQINNDVNTNNRDSKNTSVIGIHSQVGSISTCLPIEILVYEIFPFIAIVRKYHSLHPFILLSEDVKNFMLVNTEWRFVVSKYSEKVPVKIRFNKGRCEKCFSDSYYKKLINDIKDIGLRFIFDVAYTNFCVDQLKFFPKSLRKMLVGFNTYLCEKDSLSLIKWLSEEKNYKDFSSFTYFNFCFKNIGDKGGEYLFKMTRLEILFAKNNGIGDEGLQNISRMKNLKILELCHNYIGDKGAEHLSCLDSLRDMDVSYNYIGTIGAKHFSNMKKLKSLNVSHNPIGDDGTKYLLKMVWLEILNVKGCEISGGMA